MRLVPCLDALWAEEEGGIYEQISVVKMAGYSAVEIWDWRGKDLMALEGSSLELVAMSGNTFDEPLVDPQGGEKACSRILQSFEVAHKLGCRKLVIHAGYRLPHLEVEEQRTNMMELLCRIASLDRSITLLIEPLNTIDHPGYFLDSLPEAITIIREVGEPNVRLLLDCYHVQMLHGEVAPYLDEAVPFTAHVHIADVPGRGEPGTGTMNYPVLLGQIEGRGYDGDVGLEFWTPDPLGSLLRVKGLIP
ncbi:MAG: TIM barrel protein [Armatimonadota bacterium]|nr:TIM barrel protein [Armatimonadota bacterium]